MSVVNVRLLDSIHRAARKLAKQDGISISQFINLAVAEKVSALMTDDYLKERARRASKKKFQRALATVPDVEPAPEDRL